MNFPTCIQTQEAKNNSSILAENSPKNKQNLYESPKKTKNISFNYYNNDDNKNSFNTIPKPDFSPFNSNKLSVKPYGSYKKQKIIYPESPAKIPGSKYFTPSNTKLISKQLFSTNQTSENNNFNYNNNFNNIINKKQFFIRKLNFDESENMKKNLFNNDDEDNYNLNLNLNYNKINFDIKKTNDYEIISIINNGNFGEIYKVKSKKNNKIFAMKKTKKIINETQYEKILKINNILTQNKNEFSNFIIKFNEIFLEKNEYNLPNLHLITNYYENGDLFDYLSNLEKKFFSFNSCFYWNIIFEMMCGLFYIHNYCNLIHLDIKPENFLVDLNGNLHLSDFDLCQIKNENNFYNINFNEGDIKYVSNEVFTQKNIDEKSDVYSLGISILEIMSKIDLPENGEVWRLMRSKNFDISLLPKDFFEHWNIKNDKDKFCLLINDMICDYDKRKNIQSLFNDYDELKKRFFCLMNKNYFGNKEFFNNTKELSQISEEDGIFSSSKKKLRLNLDFDNEFDNNNNFNDDFNTPNNKSPKISPVYTPIKNHNNNNDNNDNNNNNNNNLFCNYYKNEDDNMQID